jgi:hypothetical protein
MSLSRQAVSPTLVLQLGLLLGAVSFAQACSSGADSVIGAGAGAGAQSGARGLSLGGARSVDAAGGMTPSVGAAKGVGGGVAGASSVGGAQAVNPTGLPANAPCTTPSSCLAGRCEPVTGTAGEVCLAACFADGAACTRALDCCSTGCFNGKCGGKCTVEGDSCANNAECCSGVCEGGRCQVDMPNRDCRPTGEDCSSGSGSGCCNQCDKETKRCGFGADTCFAQGVACSNDAQCCRGQCLNQVCTTPCVAVAGACTAGADCCTAHCSASGVCEPPPPVLGTGGAMGVGGASSSAGASAIGGAPVVTCTLTGDSCANNGQCCSQFCLGGFCEAPIR